MARRVLALAHYLWGALLLTAAGWFASAVFRVLPYMSSGTGGERVGAVVAIAAAYAFPLASAGAVMLALGRMTWSGHPHLQPALLLIHGLMLIPGGLATALGIYGMRAAARSSAAGGGLLGPVAAIPLAFGLPVVLLALASIGVALTSKRPAR